MATGAFAAHACASARASSRQRGRRHDAVDQADAKRLGGVDHAAAEDQFQRAALPHQPREALRAGETGREAELDLGLAELRGVGRQPHRARHRELASAAQGETVDRGDHGLAQLLDHVEHALPEFGVRLGRVRRQRGQFVDVRPGHERLLAGAGQDDDAYGRVGPQRAECLAQFRQRGGVERVEHLRPVDRDGGDGPVDGDEEVFVGHRVTCSRARLYPTREWRPPRRTRPRVGEKVEHIGVPAWHEGLMELVGRAVEDRDEAGGEQHRPGRRAQPALASAPRRRAARARRTRPRAAPCPSSSPAAAPRRAPTMR